MTYQYSNRAEDNINLVLKFRLAGDSRLHVKGAVRMKVDGRGGLTFYDAQSGTTERINLRDLQSFCVQQVLGSDMPLAS
jgi:hypothetical protein